MQTGKDSSAPSKSVEERLSAIEDRLAIYQLIASHTLAVDGKALEYWEKQFTEDAIMDRGAVDPDRHSGNRSGAYGKAEIMREVGSPEMDALRETGLAHLNTVPFVEINGAEATATNYTQLVVCEGRLFTLRRVVCSRWQLVRGADGAWRIRSRTFRLIDGKAEPRTILRSAVQPDGKFDLSKSR